MEADDRVELLRLLRERKVLALAVLVEGEPYASQLPFTATPGLDALLVHATRLARHARGLVEGGPWSAVIAEPELEGSDPFSLARLTLQGKIEVLERDSEPYEQARQAFLAKLPQGGVMFGLGDFNLYRLRIERGRLFSGFARTLNLSPLMLAELAGEGR